jgi:Cys-rich four helix bundle protein (predicted Tat secretion target)
MNRREALLNSGAMVLSASLGAIACGAQNAVAQSAGAPAVTTAASGPAADAAFECLKKGEACADHCVRMLVTGDTSMAECMVAVRDMLAGTEALARLASTGSRHLRSAAKLALDVCETCEAACRKHAQMHVVCRDCADACTHTIAECRKLVS